MYWLGRHTPPELHDDNRAAHASAAYTANLKLTGFSTSGDPALTTNLSNFSGLAAGNGDTFTASLNTANHTATGTKTLSFRFNWPIIAVCPARAATTAGA